MPDERKHKRLEQEATPGRQPVSCVEDDRVRPSEGLAGCDNVRPQDGVDGPITADREGYRTYYGETAYAGGQYRAGGKPRDGQSVHGGQQGSHGRGPDHDPAIDDPRRGLAGSRGVIPGAGADKGPEENPSTEPPSRAER